MMIYSRLLSIWKEVNTELMEDVGVCNSCWTGSFLTHTSCVKRPIGISPSNSPLHWRIKTENWIMKNTIDISYYSIILYSKDTCLLISLPCFVIWNVHKTEKEIIFINSLFWCIHCGVATCNYCKARVYYILDIHQYKDHINIEK